MAGFNGRNHVHTSHLVDAGGNLPAVIIFVDFEEHVNRVLPKLYEMAPHRLIVRENVVIEQGSLDKLIGPAAAAHRITPRCTPLSTVMISPVTLSAPSSNQTTASATSSGRTVAFSGVMAW